LLSAIHYDSSWHCRRSPGGAWPCRPHVSSNPRSDLRRLPRKYDVKITSQSQTGLPRDRRPEVQRACPGQTIYYDGRTDGRRRLSNLVGVSTSRQNEIWTRAATRMQRYANEVVRTVAVVLAAFVRTTDEQIARTTLMCALPYTTVPCHGHRQQRSADPIHFCPRRLRSAFLTT